jgi:diacylglycerol kinase family enzyme
MPSSRKEPAVWDETAAADVDDPGRTSADVKPMRRAAVVIHPAKHDNIDGFRATVHEAMADLGWSEPLWLATVLRADSGPPRRRWASGVIVGNVGSLPGNVRLLPDAVPDDGVLDVAVLAARGWLGWLRLAADVLLRRQTGRVAHLTCRELVVDASRVRRWEVDGEVAGTTRQLRVTLEPGRLLVRVPARTDG